LETGGEGLFGDGEVSIRLDVLELEEGEEKDERLGIGGGLYGVSEKYDLKQDS
jgi:hypothetical protein